MTFEFKITKLALQWGRNLTVAEGAEAGQTQRTTEVLQWGRNLTVAEGSKRRPRPRARIRFNGAAT